MVPSRDGSGSFLIVGAGNFGAATALALINSNPAAKVTIVDSCPFPNPRAASHDINKIIRPDYADSAYTRLMLEAMPLWRSSPLYSQFYHETGMLRVDPSGFSEGCLESYKSLGAEASATWLTVDEVKSKWRNALGGANFEGVEKCFWSPQSGWADADRALAAVTQAAIDHGVSYRAEAVRKLIIRGGVCTGVKLEGGQEMNADCIVMCAGARTAPLLAESAPRDEKIQAGKRVIATGAVSFFVRLDGRERDRFKDVPVVKNCLKHTKGKMHLQSYSLPLLGS
jgi:sarcosine oxidase/L-pipecolate oxidase